MFWGLLFLQKVLANAPSIIVSSQWVHEHRNDPEFVILQVDFLKPDYEKGHIVTLPGH